jgi:monoamine oxidase
MARGSDYDVVIIGAGAAGIAAARRLVERRLSVLLLEARDRVGGRAHTAATDVFLPVDLGCEWLHSADRNELTRIARDRGFTVDEKLPDWGTRLRRAGASPEEEREWYATRNAFTARLDAAAAEGEDRAAASLLAPGNRWNGLLGAISTWANGTELEKVSVHDHARYADSGVNWRLREGYGALIASLAAGLPVALGNPVHAVDHGASPIRVAAARGSMTARAVLVTLPTALIAEAAVRFTPALPAEKRAAAAGLPLGLADKLFLALSGDGPDLAPDSHVVGRLDRVATGSYQIRPYGRPLIAGYFGGALARELEIAGSAAMADFAAAELAGLFGNGIRRQLRLLAASAWASDPFARGSYSCALPGHAEARAILGAPVDDHLFFAGEAVAPEYFSTAHGAYQSGLVAAEAITRVLAG